MLFQDVRHHEFTHLGRAGQLVPIILKNFLLQVMTLGLYRFWAITRVRHYLWSRTFFRDDPLNYSGTGKELFLGFLLAAVIVLLPIYGLAVLAGVLQASGDTTAASVATGASTLLVLMLTPFALYRARRYRLNRTSWRGIRWGQGGSAILYAVRWLGFWLLTMITLGLAYPWQSIGLERYRLNHTYFGSYPFRFSGTARPLFGRWLVAWAIGMAIAVALVAIPFVLKMDNLGDAPVSDVTELPRVAAQQLLYLALTVLPGLAALVAVFCWYKAAELRYVAENSHYEELRFRCTVTGGQLAWLGVGNLLIRFFTLGLGAPYALVRTARLMARTLSAEGAIDFERVRQNADELSKTGEGLAAAINVGEF